MNTIYNLSDTLQSLMNPKCKINLNVQRNLEEMVYLDTFHSDFRQRFSTESALITLADECGKAKVIP